MLDLTKQVKIEKLFLMSVLLAAMAIAGCAGPKIAPDLLANVEVSSEPLVNNAVSIDVGINPEINNSEKLDESVKESLQIALDNANIFGADATRPYRISANILVASQSTWSFGSFEGKLEISYALFDDLNNKIVDEKIYTEAGSDKNYFSGAARHRRSRAVNISKNVLEFVEILRTQFKE